MSDSVRPHRWKPTRLPCPWDSPGKNTGVGCHFLLQCRKVRNESEVSQSCLTLSEPMDCSPPGSSVHGIFQARVLEWGAIAFSITQVRLHHFSSSKPSSDYLSHSENYQKSFLIWPLVTFPTSSSVFTVLLFTHSPPVNLTSLHFLCIPRILPPPDQCPNFSASLEGCSPQTLDMDHSLCH